MTATLEKRRRPKNINAGECPCCGEYFDDLSEHEVCTAVIAEVLESPVRVTDHRPLTLKRVKMRYTRHQHPLPEEIYSGEYLDARRCGFQPFSGRTVDGLPVPPFEGWYSDWWVKLDQSERSKLIDLTHPSETGGRDGGGGVVTVASTYVPEMIVGLALTWGGELEVDGQRVVDPFRGQRSRSVTTIYEHHPVDRDMIRQSANARQKKRRRG